MASSLPPAPPLALCFAGGVAITLSPVQVASLAYIKTIKLNLNSFSGRDNNKKNTSGINNAEK
jgi:hypothetical protein